MQGCTVMDKRRLPPFASGSIVEDYETLFIYWEKARSRGREDLIEKSTLSNTDFDKLRVIVEEGTLTLEELLDRLSRDMTERIDPEVAVEALRERRIFLEADDARRYLARILAGWLIEAGEYWGILRLRRGWTSGREA